MKRLTAQNYGNDDGEECLRSVFKNGQNSFSLARLLTEFPCMEYYFLVHEHPHDFSIFWYRWWMGMCNMAKRGSVFILISFCEETATFARSYSSARALFRKLWNRNWKKGRRLELGGRRRRREWEFSFFTEDGSSTEKTKKWWHENLRWMCEHHMCRDRIPLGQIVSFRVERRI